MHGYPSLMLPGPIDLTEDVLCKMSHSMVGHINLDASYNSIIPLVYVPGSFLCDKLSLDEEVLDIPLS